MTNAVGVSQRLVIGAFPAINDQKYPDIYQDLVQVHNAIRSLQAALDSVTNTIVIANVLEDIPAGAMVNFVTDSNGALGAQKAYAVNGNKPCHAFAMNNYGYSQQGQFQTAGFNELVSGLTPGTQFYLSDITAGHIISSPPVTAGHLVQKVGVAITPNQLLFTPAFNWKQL